jgi:hypothetical protein
VANVVVVLKKDGKIKICVNYRDLNKTSLNDDFPLSYIDVLIDNVANKYHLLIRMAGKDRKNYLCHILGNSMLQGDSIWIEERRDHLSKGKGHFIS